MNYISILLMRFARIALIASNNNAFLFMFLRCILLLRCFLFFPKSIPKIININFQTNKSKSIILYFGIKSSYYNVNKIIEFLLVERTDWQIFLLSSEPIEELDKISKTKKIPYEVIDFLCLSCLKCDLFITPTDIPYKIAKPTGSTSVYFVHSLVGIKHISHDHSFDGTDYIFAAGPRQADDFITHLEKRRQKGKIIIPGGYPKLDSLIQKKESTLKPKSNSDAKTIVIALTYNNGLNSEHVILNRIIPITESLVTHKYRVILRPHPISFAKEKDLFEISKFIDCFSGENNVIVDKSKDYFSIFQESFLMISDISGTAYTYALSLLKPVVFFSPVDKAINAYHFIDRTQIGRVAHSIPELIESIHDIENNYSSVIEQIKTYRLTSISNCGSSSEYFMSIIDTIANHNKPEGATLIS